MTWMTKLFSPSSGKKTPETTVQDLLDFIAKYESNGNYNVLYGGRTKPLTTMTINQVLKMQEGLGGPSTAAGRYQIIRITLRELRDKMKLRGTEIFDKKMQDRMAVCLLERRGLNKNLGTEKFMLNLSKEWASLPRDKSGKSYYAGDGLNKAHAPYKRFREIVEGLNSY